MLVEIRQRAKEVMNAFRDLLYLDYFYRKADAAIAISAIARYCSEDTAAAYGLFRVLWGKFREKFPNLVSLAAMIMMRSEMKLPALGFHDYVKDAEEAFVKAYVKIQAIILQLVQDRIAEGAVSTLAYIIILMSIFYEFLKGFR